MQQRRENHNVRKMFGRRKKQSLLKESKPIGVQNYCTFSQEIERLLRQGLENELAAVTKESKGKPVKPENGTQTGKILIINDAPGASGRLAQWLARTEYHYRLVRNSKEAEALSENESFDTIVQSSELLFRKQPTNHSEGGTGL